jgi:hypothetical protein
MSLIALPSLAGNNSRNKSRKYKQEKPGQNISALEAAAGFNNERSIFADLLKSRDFCLLFSKCQKYDGTVDAVGSMVMSMVTGNASGKIRGFRF